MNFEWDPTKDIINQEKHGVFFFDAQKAFADPRRVIAIDWSHSTRREKRFFCFGKIVDRVITVRFTYRENKIRIYGAGFWREGRQRYEKENRL